MDANTLQSIKMLKAGFQAVIDVAAEFERVGSVEKAEQEARARRDAAVKEFAAVSGKLAAAKAELSAVSKDAGSALAAANADADAIRAQATEVAKKTVEDAAAMASGIKDRANDAAAKAIDAAKANAKAVAEASAARKAEIDAMIDARQNQLQALVVATAEAQQKFDDITARIAKAKTAAKAMLE